MAAPCAGAVEIAYVSGLSPSGSDAESVIVAFVSSSVLAEIAGTLGASLTALMVTLMVA